MNIADIENKRKFLFFTKSGIIGLLILTIFLIINIINNASSLIILDLQLMAIMIIWYVALRTFKSHKPIYRIGLLAILIAFLYAVSKGGSGQNMLYSLFFIPLLLFFFLNEREGLIWCTIFFVTMCVLLLKPFSTDTYDYERVESVYFLLPLLFVIIMAYQLESSRSQYSDMFLEEQAKLKREKESLKAAIEEIKTLSGMLPICASCKSIRDDEGYWNKLEEYMSKHSDVKFSHGICPDCAKKLYPDLDIFDD